MCQDIQWKEGILSLISSKMTKDQFILAPFSEKMDFIVNILAPSQLKAVIETKEDLTEQEDQVILNDPFVNEVKQTMFQFPYIISSWRIKDPISQKDDYDFDRFINEVNVSFNEQCVTVIDQIN